MPSLDHVHRLRWQHARADSRYRRSRTRARVPTPARVQTISAATTTSSRYAPRARTVVSPGRLARIVQRTIRRKRATLRAVRRYVRIPAPTGAPQKMMRSASAARSKTARKIANGCLAWHTTTDCAANSPALVCDASGGQPTCIDTCTNSCLTENAVQCAGDAIQTCTRGSDGCLDWATTSDCSSNTPAQTCDASGRSSLRYCLREWLPHGK